MNVFSVSSVDQGCS